MHSDLDNPYQNVLILHQSASALDAEISRMKGQLGGGKETLVGSIIA